jgi:hypothetical protein
MSPQADFIVSNGTGAAVRSDLNVQFAAIVSNNSGATEPATMYAYQWWADTTTGLLKLRNSANSAWVTIRQLDGEFSTVPVENGSAAAPSIYFKDSGTDSGFFSPGTDAVAISTAGTNRLHITSGGLVGLGTSSPSGPLHVTASSDGYISSTFSNTSAGTSAVNRIQIGNDASDGTGQLVMYGSQHSTLPNVFDITNATNNPLRFLTNNTEQVRITGAGNVGIGTTSPTRQLHIHNNTTAYLQLTTSGSISGASGGFQLICNGAGDLRANLVQRENAPMTFSTNDTERVRIDSSGRLLIGTSSGGSGATDARQRIITSGNNLYLGSTAAGGWRLVSDALNDGGGFYHINFLENGSQRGSITSNGSSTSYTTTSDYRLKENVTIVTDGITRLQQLKPSRFNFITNPAMTVDGFIAHEVQAIVPEAITGEKNAVDDDGNPIYQGIDQSKLVPLLTAALQEAIAKIETLEARLTALESA